MKKGRRLRPASSSADSRTSEHERGQSPSKPAGARKRRVEALHTAAICHARHEAGQGCAALLQRFNIAPKDDEAELEALMPALATPTPALTELRRSQRTPAKPSARFRTGKTSPEAATASKRNRKWIREPPKM
jgi:hypothetical protein